MSEVKPLPAEPAALQADPQSSEDSRGVSLDRVGISQVRYPVLIAGWDTESSLQRELEGVFDLVVSLDAKRRGIHMSRLIESLHRWTDPLCPASLQNFLEELREQQEANSSEMSCAFIWFVDRPSPTTKHPAWQGIETTWHATRNADGGRSGYALRIPVTTLCPCSRAISDYGAHSQRGWISVKVDWQHNTEIVAPKEVFEQLQHAGSAPIYPLLKRPDERHVTMTAYDQPVFVEDAARRAASLLRNELRISSFRIEVRNEESIHSHDAVAVVTSGHLSE